MAKLYVPKEGTGRDAVQFTDLEEYYEKVESDDRWPIRAFLEFEGCDVIIVRLARAVHVVDVVIGIYDALFGWQGRRFDFEPRHVRDERALTAIVEVQASVLRGALQRHYEGERPRSSEQTYGPSLYEYYMGRL